MAFLSRLKALRRTSKNRPAFSCSQISICATLYILFCFNIPVLNKIYHEHGLHNLHDFGFMLSATILTGILIHLTVMMLGFRPFFKPAIILLIITSAATSYFMRSYHIMIDSSMMANIIETDYKEASALFSRELVFSVVFLAGIPSAILLLIPVNHEKLLKSIFRNILVVTSCCICIGIIAGFYYQDYASLLRNNRHLRDQIIPLNFIYAGFSYGKDQLKNKTRNLQPVGRDAQAKTDWRNIPSGKKVISIIVIGETARAQSFSLGGYNRKTNPELEKQDIIYFDNFSSCGTTTSVSVPCMFSPFPEKRFSTSDAANHENLLDVLMHAGLDVLWRDNNSGCKGVCERVEYDDVSHLQEIELCNDDECYDEILLNKLNDKIESYPVNNGLVIVLHMHGSHGPDYFLRAPKAFRQFTPFCHTNQLQDCTRQEILNAYDNTILYSDHVLNQIIDFLKQHQSSYSSSLLFLSDHGESLGESNLYLHGLPRSIAPQEQTRIPAFLWLSESFSDDFHINNHCLEQIAHKPFSHDNLFHSVLGMLDLSTKVYQADLDLFRACKIETKADLS